MRKFLRKLLFPHGAWLFVLAPLSVAVLVYRFKAPGIPEAAEYAAYILSAYTLTVFYCRLPALVRFLRTLVQQNKYMARYQSDTRWRITVTLYSSFTVNCAYALLQFGLGVYHDAVWYYSMAAYYLLLAVMRFYLLGYTRNHAPGENRKKEWLRQNRTFIHHMITTIAMAAYTFTAFTMSIVGLIRYRKYESPVLSAAKVIGLVAAMVSMLTLETTMLTVFGEGEGVSWIVSAATGGIYGSLQENFQIMIGMCVEAHREE